jgi:hypothetical protein
MRFQKVFKIAALLLLIPLTALGGRAFFDGAVVGSAMGADLFDPWVVAVSVGAVIGLELALLVRELIRR